MIVKLIQADSPESLGNMLHIKGLEEYLVDITKGKDSYLYLYDTDSDEIEVEPNKLFSIYVKTISGTTENLENKELFKFYVCELSETEKTCETWSFTGYCFGNFKVLFEVEGPRVTERLMTWWERTKAPTLKLAKAIVLDQQLRDELN